MSEAVFNPRDYYYRCIWCGKWHLFDELTVKQEDSYPVYYCANCEEYIAIGDIIKDYTIAPTQEYLETMDLSDAYKKHLLEQIGVRTPKEDTK